MADAAETPDARAEPEASVRIRAPDVRGGPAGPGGPRGGGPSPRGTATATESRAVRYEGPLPEGAPMVARRPTALAGAGRPLRRPAAGGPGPRPRRRRGAPPQRVRLRRLRADPRRGLRPGAGSIVTPLARQELRHAARLGLGRVVAHARRRPPRPAGARRSGSHADPRERVRRRRRPRPAGTSSAASPGRVRHAADGGRHHRQPGGERLEQHLRHALRPRHVQQRVARAVQLGSSPSIGT